MAKVAILGFGTVGSGVYELLKNRETISKRAGKPVELAYILDIREFPGHEAESLFTKSFDDILNDSEVSVVAEVIGGATIAYEYTKKALLAGKSVVTSNKELVATHGAELLSIAKENGVYYLFEASVGGGIPIIHPLNQCLAANEISEIFGILNGTTNYILTCMFNNGQSFEDALKNAQSLGYAEANPAADVEGTDACRKIAILSDLAFGKEVSPDEIPTEGITNITPSDIAAAELTGNVIKLIGYCRKEENGVCAKVSPMAVPESYALSRTSDVFNAIMVRGHAIGDALFYGKGAGKLPTASAVVADIIDAVSGSCRSIIWEKSDTPYKVYPDTAKSNWLVRAESDFDTSSVKEVSFEGKSGDELVFVAENLTQQEISDLAQQEKGIIKFIRILK